MENDKIYRLQKDVGNHLSEWNLDIPTTLRCAIIVGLTKDGDSHQETAFELLLRSIVMVYIPFPTPKKKPLVPFFGCFKIPSLGKKVFFHDLILSSLECGVQMTASCQHNL